MHEENHLQQLQPLQPSQPSQQPLADVSEVQEDQREHKSDQRKLGRELGLFMFSPDVGAGLPLWLPNTTVVNVLY